VAEETKYAELTVEQLGEELEKRGLKKSGKKDELIARLEDDDTAQGGTAPEAEEAPAEEEAEAPKPRRRRSAETAPAPVPKAALRGVEGGVMVRARARYVRSAPRKARLVMEHIRGRPVEQARAILDLTPRAVSGDILKLLDSAVANAESNYELAADELRVQKAYVDEGPTIKRYRPRALGRATRINKRTSHMTIELTTQDRAHPAEPGASRRKA
jgi:large subunit ribosomal protein L22